jgi:hypothetical protein
MVASADMSTPKLTPFWFQPDPDSPAEFHLRPLTPSEYLEVRDMIYIAPDGKPRSGAACARAAQMGVIGVRNLADPETGKKAVWPQCSEWVSPSVIELLGLRLVVAAQGKEWTEADADDLKDDPEGNSQSSSP